jgi:predicted TIM-barrel fold metal-dependent hydrolase
MTAQVLDFHAHVFPTKVAHKAVEAISAFYDAPMSHSGDSVDLIVSGSRIGVARYVVHSTATRPDQVSGINDFIRAECLAHPEFIGFGTLHRDFPDLESEIGRICAMGLRGIKLHPDFQRFAVDDPALSPLYSLARERRLPVLVHAGDRRYDFSGPERIARVLDAFPGLIMIGAHFGGYTEWDRTMEHLVGRDIYFDTSSTLWKLDPKTARRMIDGHGSDKFLFGSDYPMWDHAEELEKLEKVGLSESERQAILWDNGARLLGLGA